ncbi:MAG: linear amide C-N hydrolase [Bacilli bacterium]|nr:linear amide C-N hydrolase [Bacilli bacterium]
MTSSKEGHIHVKEQKIFLNRIYDYVMDAGTYQEIDEDTAYAYLDSTLDVYGGLCTAVAKNTKTDGVIVGRNMDLYISNNPSYFFRTECKNRYKTMGLTYINNVLPRYEDVAINGLDKAMHQVIPTFATDVMNEHGLYIEVNMREGDVEKDGSLTFACKGTRSTKGLPYERRLCASALCFYLGQRCKTVAEAVEYATNKLDLYTPGPETPLPWNFCFVLADATGEYGLLEIASEKVIYTRGSIPGHCDSGDKEMRSGSCQANFYVAPELAATQKMKVGLGRYQKVKEAWPSIENESDMFTLLDSLTYFQAYFPQCKFDNLSEFVGTIVDDSSLAKRIGLDEKYLGYKWDLDFVYANEKIVRSYIEYQREKLLDLLREGKLHDANSYWESAFTIVANCTEKRMFVRFNETNKNCMLFEMK